MAWRLFFTSLKSSQTLNLTSIPTSSKIPSFKPFLFFITSPFSTSFLVTKTPKKFKKKRNKKESPRTKLVQSEPNRIPHFEQLVERDAFFRFLNKSKDFLSKQPEHVLLLDDAGKLYRELGFPRGRKVARSIERHPLIFQSYRHTDGKMWFGFTEFMEELLDEEKAIMDLMELDRISKVRKLLMMSAKKRIALSKIYHCRSLFGIPEDFRDRVIKYQNYFRIVVEDDGKRILELVNWDPLLAVSQLEREFMVDEERAKKAFKFPVKHGKNLDLDEDDMRKLNLLNTLPLVSPYSEGSKLDLWTLEAEKYRVGLLHEFLSLTLEKRASIHHIVEFKEEFSLTKHTYQMLSKQPRTFYLAGTEMNWVVFLTDAYDESGTLIDKDPQVVFSEKLIKYAEMQSMESGQVSLVLFWEWFLEHIMQYSGYRQSFTNRNCYYMAPSGELEPSILDIGCDHGTFGAHVLSKQLITMCVSSYEASGSQVQLTLKTCLPSDWFFTTKQLPYPFFSFEMVHCARCGVGRNQKGVKPFQCTPEHAVWCTDGLAISKKSTGTMLDLFQ